MSRSSRALAALVLALFVTSCASWQEPPVGDPSYPASRARFGALGDSDQVLKWVPAAKLTAITGTSQTITLWDSTGGVSGQAQTQAHIHRIMFTGRCTQDFTLKYQTLATGSSTWRTRNGYAIGTPTAGVNCVDTTGLGAGAGVTVPATTDVACDFLVLGPDSRLVAVTGTSPTCEYDIRLGYETPPGM